MATIEEKRLQAKRKLAKQKLLSRQQSMPADEGVGAQGGGFADTSQQLIDVDKETGVALAEGGIDGSKKALAGFLATMSPEARIDIIKNNIPGAEITQEGDLTFVDLPLSSGGGAKIRTTLNKPGLSGQDIQDFAGLALQFSPQGKIASLGKNLAQRIGIVAAKDMGVETVRQLASTQLGSDQGVEPEVIAEAGASSVFGQSIGEAFSQASRLASDSIKGIFRGGEQGRLAVKESIDAFNVSGSSPTLGQATGRPSLQAIESTSGKAPGGRPLRDQLVNTGDSVQKKLASMADEISGVKGEEIAGRVIQKGITGTDGFVSRFQAKSGALWDKMDDFIPKKSQISVKNTRETLDELVRGDAFGRILDNKQLADVKVVLDDVDGVVDYETLKTLRSTIGRKLGSNDLISDIPRAELKRLYGSLSEDMKVAASDAGGDALKSFNRANKFTKAGHDRLDDFIERVSKKVNLDQVFNAVVKGGEGSQTINAFKRSLKPDEWDVVTSNVIRRLGKATPGAQDALGDAFSLNKFLTDWNKLGSSKKALFSGSDKLNRMGSDLDSIAKTAERVKSASSELAGQSGTAQLATSIGTGSVFAGSAMTGNVPVAGSVLALVSANNGAARLMSSPKFVNWLAKTTELSASKLPSQISKLAIIANSADEQEAQAIASFIEDAKGE